MQAKAEIYDSFSQPMKKKMPKKYQNGSLELTILHINLPIIYASYHLQKKKKSFKKKTWVVLTFKPQLNISAFPCRILTKKPNTS